MFAKFIVLFGAILGCALVVASESLEKTAITKVNQILIDATGPGVTDLATNVQKAMARDKEGYWQFEGPLRSAMEKFLTVTRANGTCTLDLVFAMGFLLIDEDSSTRINKILNKEVWGGATMKNCADSLGDLVDKYNSRLPKDDETQTYLRHVPHSLAKTIYHPFVAEFRDEYYHNPAIVNELLSIAEEKSIVLVENKFDKVANKTKSSTQDKRCNELVKKYYLEPCDIYSKTSANFARFIEFVQKRQTNVPLSAWNLYYRVEACKVFKSLEKEHRQFKLNVKSKILKRYSKKHPVL